MCLWHVFTNFESTNLRLYYFYFRTILLLRSKISAVTLKEKKITKKSGRFRIRENLSLSCSPIESIHIFTNFKYQIHNFPNVLTNQCVSDSRTYLINFWSLLFYRNAIWFLQSFYYIVPILNFTEMIYFIT